MARGLAAPFSHRAFIELPFTLRLPVNLFEEHVSLLKLVIQLSAPARVILTLIISIAGVAEGVNVGLGVNEGVMEDVGEMVGLDVGEMVGVGD